MLKIEFLEYQLYIKCLKQVTIIQLVSPVLHDCNKMLLLSFHGRQSSFPIAFFVSSPCRSERILSVLDLSFCFSHLLSIYLCLSDDFCWTHDLFTHVFKWLLGQFPFSDFKQLEIRKNGKRSYTKKGRVGTKESPWIPTSLPSCPRWQSGKALTPQLRPSQIFLACPCRIPHSPSHTGTSYCIIIAQCLSSPAKPPAQWSEEQVCLILSALYF